MDQPMPKRRCEASLREEKSFCLTSTMPSSTIYFCKAHRAYFYTKAELMDHHRIVHGDAAPANDMLYKCTPIAPSPKKAGAPKKTVGAPKR